MSRYANFAKISKRGSVDSKYFGRLDKFEEDINFKIQQTEKFKNTIRELILKEPDKIEQRISNIIEVIKKIKEEFNV